MRDTQRSHPSSGDDDLAETARTETNRASYDWESTKPLTAIVETVATARETDPVDLPPLYGRIDVEAVDALFAQARDERTVGPHRLTFPYAGCDVTIDSVGEVLVDPRAAGD